MTERKFEINPDKSPDYPVVMWAIIRALKEMGGLATNDDIAKQIIKNENVSEEELSYPQAGDKYRPKFKFALTFARTYLKSIGALENPNTGVWELTDMGLQIRSVEELDAFYKENINQRRRIANQKNAISKNRPHSLLMMM